MFFEICANLGSSVRYDIVEIETWTILGHSFRTLWSELDFGF